MPRLIWVIAGRTCHFVGFAMRWLKWCTPLFSLFDMGNSWVYIHVHRLVNVMGESPTMGGVRGGSGERGSIETPFNSEFHFLGKFWLNLINFGYRIYPKYSHSCTIDKIILLPKNVWNCWMSGKQCRPWSDAAFCGVWSGCTLFAQTSLSEYVE